MYVSIDNVRDWHGVYSDRVNARHWSFVTDCYLPSAFQCNNGQCISQSIVCDGTLDCEDGSDESQCGGRFFYIIILLSLWQAGYQYCVICSNREHKLQFWWFNVYKIIYETYIMCIILIFIYNHIFLHHNILVFCENCLIRWTLLILTFEREFIIMKVCRKKNCYSDL